MLALLTLSLASAEPPTSDDPAGTTDSVEMTAATRALVASAARCCMTTDVYVPASQEIPVHKRSYILDLFPGHTRRGNADYLGGTPLVDQLVAVDGLPMMLDHRLGPVDRRMGTLTTPHNHRLIPRPGTAHPW